MTATNKDNTTAAAAAIGIRERKQVLRKEIRTKLKALSPEEIRQESLKVWDRLFALPEYQAAKSVALFLSMPAGEISTDAALQDAVLGGKAIYVPQVGKNFEQTDMEMLKVVDPKAVDGTLFHHSWPRNKWGYVAFGVVIL
jgi:5-formyltetrahydrofolate cyclo-ligase